MRKWVSYSLCWMHAFLIMSLPLAIYELIEPGSQGLWGYLRCLYILLPVVMTYFGIRRFKKLWKYFLLCAVVIALGVFLGYGEWEALLSGLTACAVCMMRFASRLRQTESWMDRPAPSFLLLFCILYIAALYFEQERVKTLLYYYTGIYVILIMVHRNINNVNEFLSYHKNIANLPASAIRMISDTITVILAAAAGVIFFLVPRTSLEKLLYTFKVFLVAIMRAMVWLLSLFTGKSAEEVIEAETEAAQDIGSLLPEDAYVEPRWLEIVKQIFEMLLYIAAIAVVVAAIGYLLYTLYKRFYLTRAETDDEVEFLGALAKQERAGTSSSKKRRQKLFDFSAEAIIRRQYKRLIIKRTKTHPAPADTPLQLEENAGLDTLCNEVQVLHEYYEKARYSSITCIREQSEEMKLIVQSLSRNNTCKSKLSTTNDK